MSERSILIIYTGGTIGMVKSAENNSLVPMDFSNIRGKVPELSMFDFDVQTIAFDPPIDSSEISPSIWVKIARTINTNYNKFDGFVILHGTDTMAYTASALSYMLCNLSKPVVLTGSQLPMGTIRTDGKENLIAAIEIAAAQEHNPAIVPEVCIYFQSKLLRGNRTTKFNAENLNAFRSDNYPALADVGISIKYNYPYIRYSAIGGTLSVSEKMDTNVVIIKIFPGITRKVLHAMLSVDGLRGAVLETFGSGNAPTYEWFIEELSEAIKRGVTIVNVTQCMSGSVEMWRYDTGVHLKQIGVVSGYDITTEAAVTKLMYLLGNYTDVGEVRMMLNKSLRGEISVR